MRQRCSIRSGVSTATYERCASKTICSATVLIDTGADIYQLIYKPCDGDSVEAELRAVFHESATGIDHIEAYGTAGLRES